MKSNIRMLFVFILVFAFAGVLLASDFLATSLNNIEVGGQNSQIVSIRFRAKTDGPLAAVRLYWIIQNPSGDSGYASGTGGHFTYSLRADANGQLGKTLATASVIRNQITENQRGNFPLVSFPPVDHLVRGQYYDIVVENVDRNPSENWASLDFLWDPIAKNQTPDVQIWISSFGGAFAPGDGGTFIGSPVALFYSDGVVQGYGDVDVGPSYPGGLECGSGYGFPTSICQ